MKPFAALLLASTAALTLACSKQAETPAAVNVQALDQEFITAWNARNAIQLDTLMADDVHFLQGEAHYQGKAEVSEKWIRATMGTIANLRLNPATSANDEKTAFEGGTYSVDVLPAGNQPGGIGEGNFVLIWKKNPKGLWKLGYAQLEGLPVRIRQ